MAKIRSCDTKPELMIRSLLHRLGYRFRLHLSTLPGKPDLAFPSRRKVIFVHGCFWHNHDCNVGHVPRSRSDYWKEKFERNKRRDEENSRKLDQLGWDHLVIWECEIKDLVAVRERAEAFLEETPAPNETKPGAADQSDS